MKISNKGGRKVFKNNTVYNIINIFVMLITAGLFVTKYKTIYNLFDNYSLGAFIVLVCTVVLVHLLKVSRLYLALYGSGTNGKDFIKTYCKVTPPSVVLPFKLGEVFRMYCYGHLIGNMLRGIVIILFDRFMDTAALITVIFLTWILNGGRLDTIVYFLVFFLILILVIYFVYPGIKRFWTKYLLKSQATERKLLALKSLDKIGEIYGEIENVAKGSGIILYILSLAAWGVEIGSLSILGKINSVSEINHNVFEYLKSALGDNQSVELKRFIVITILLLIVVYTVLEIIDVLKEKRNK